MVGQFSPICITTFRPNTVIRFFYCCKNIFVHRKHTKIFYVNIISNFPTTHQQRNTSTSPITTAHIPSYMWQPLTQQAISFSPAISSQCSVISSINAHHTQLVKLFSFKFVCAKIVLRKYFSDKNVKLLDVKESELRYLPHYPL